MTTRSILAALCLMVASSTHAQSPAPEKARLLVLTDIEADPDDTQSLVRLLLYSNEIDIEGLVATTSIHMRGEIHPESIRAVLDAYDKVRANLLLHAPDYPTTSALRARVAEGQPAYGMAAVGKGKDSPGSELLIKAGFKAPVRPRIRDELWVKLWGNMAFNPLSALTTATLDKLIADPGTHAVCRALMVEGQTVAEKLGVKFALTVDKRLAGGAEVGAHKTSMLQDLERGRPLEIDALLGAVVEMAGWVGVDMPIGRTVLALVRQRVAMRHHG